MNETTKKTKGVSVHTRRVLSYIALAIATLICLFWFYVLFINATRSNDSEAGIHSNSWYSSRLRMLRVYSRITICLCSVVLNSLIIASITATLSTYFSTMTAFAIHAYDFKLKKFFFTFILAIMMIPTQVTALGFLDLIRKMKLDDNAIPLIIPAILCTICILLYEAVHGWFTSKGTSGISTYRWCWRIQDLQ